MLPMLATDRSFWQDWSNHLWYIWHQGYQMAKSGEVSYFLHTEQLGVFYPFYVFYGGTAYVIFGGLSALLGEAPVVSYIISWFTGFAMMYGGLAWISIQAGLRGWKLHVAPLVVVSSAYYLSDVYGRGAWTEFISISALPLAIASALWLIRRNRLSFWPAVALFAGVVLWTGSHSVTIVWGLLLIAALTVILILSFRVSLRCHLSGLGWSTGIALVATAVNAWYLIPTYIYGPKLSGSNLSFAPVINPGYKYSAPEYIFNIFRITPTGPNYETTLDLYVQMPVLFCALAVVVIGLSWHSLAAGYRRVAIGLVVLLCVLLALILFENDIWKHLPEFLRYIQFTYRLQMYIAFAVAGLVIVSLVGLGSRERMPRAQRRSLACSLQFGFVCISAFALVLGYLQIWRSHSSLKSRDEVFASVVRVPPTFYGDTYRDPTPHSARAVEGRTVIIDPRAPRGNDLKLLARFTGRGDYATNIVAGTNDLPLITVAGRGVSPQTATGWFVFPMTAATPLTFQAIRRTSASAGTDALAVKLSSATPIRIGRVITFVAILIVAIALVLAVLWSFRARLSARR